MKNIPQSPQNGSQLMRDKRYEITHYRDSYLKKVSLHSHDFYELYFFISGDASYIIDNLKYKLQSGDILLISPSNLHQLDMHSHSVSYERIVLWINPRYIKSLSSAQTNLCDGFELRNKNQNFLIRNYRFSENIKALLLSLCECQSANEYGADVQADILIKSILLELGRYVHSHRTANESDRVSKKTGSLVSSILSYIDNNLDKPLTLDELESVAFTSKYYLSRIFKEETNSTIHQYVLKKRLLLSKKYIEQGLPVNEVYLKCGFQDYSNFFRAFKQEYGITPKQYLTLVTN